MEFQTDEFYVKTTDEMYDAVRQWCRRPAPTPQKIADQCNFDFEFGHTKISILTKPRTGWTIRTIFEKLCWDGLERRYGSDVPTVQQGPPDL